MQIGVGVEAGHRCCSNVGWMRWVGVVAELEQNRGASGMSFAAVEWVWTAFAHSKGWPLCAAVVQIVYSEW